MSMEQWKDVVGYEGLYQVSDTGQLKRIVGYLCKTERILKQDTTKKGYKTIQLHAYGCRKTRSIHQLVLETFVGQRPSSVHVTRHLDGNASNNFIYNLAWGTVKQNTEDAFKHGTRFQPRGSQCGTAKLTENEVLSIKQLLIDKTYTQRKITAMFNVCENSISQIKLGYTWRHIE